MCPSVAFLIVAHRNASQVARLVRRLRADVPESSVVVRQDRRTLDVSTSLPYELGHVYLRDDGGRTDWGDWSLVETTMEALAWTLTRIGCDWIVCLSGQDYPTRHLSELQALLATTDRDGFLSCRPVDQYPDIKWLRYQCRWFRVRHRVGRASVAKRRVDGKLRELVRIANSRIGGPDAFSVHGYPLDLPTRLGVRRRHTPFSPEYRCWIGGAWWALRRPTAEYLVHEYRTNRVLGDHYRRCVLPDESYFHTILRNRPDVRLGDDLHYVDWSHPECSPYVFRSEDVERIVGSGKLFVRKVDSNVDAGLLDILDDRASRPNDGMQTPASSI